MCKVLKSCLSVLLLLIVLFSCAKKDHEMDSLIVAPKCMDELSESEIKLYSKYIKALGGEYVDPFEYTLDQEGFQKYLEDSGVLYFKASELITPKNALAQNSCKIVNLLPKRGCWPKGAAITLLLDQVRDEIGSPIKVLSWYRTDCYNKHEAVGGATNSDHISAAAIDVRFVNEQKFSVSKKFICNSFWRHRRDLLKDDKPFNIALGLGRREMHVGLLSEKGRRFWFYNDYRGKNSSDECF